ncbi:hypothetical protein [Veronia nyctiphanis]|uniref:hypothetical protein n=1 Tax=Veronia nyctiphanis TaxID=1278244 RepID=UPI00191C0453|nr:hypothetical protein [Veronia nyctiphanis]
MQFDIGYGPFGSGLHYRPNLDLVYQLPQTRLALAPSSVNTICAEEVTESKLASGFDANGRIVYGQMEFSPETLPEPSKTVFTKAYLKLCNKNALATGKDLRFTVELVELKDVDYQSVRKRTKIEYIGYEVSNSQLKDQSTHYFIFDSYSLSELGRLHAEKRPFYFLIRATAESQAQNALIQWRIDSTDSPSSELVIHYINRRNHPVSPATDLSYSLENNQIKLTWSNPEEEDFVGCFVVRNRFHPPRSPHDGVKLYGGKDEYTLDNFSNNDLAKYYAVFTYDHVPNYSEPVYLHYPGNETDKES